LIVFREELERQYYATIFENQEQAAGKIQERTSPQASSQWWPFVSAGVYIDPIDNFRLSLASYACGS
jgi:hypothetical protein